MAFEKYTIQQFMNAWFNKDRSIISEEELQAVMIEYIDVAGLYDIGNLDKVSYIHFLDNRINSIKLSIRLQIEFLEEFGVPYQPAFSFLWKFGHRLKWNGDKNDFVSQLEKIQKSEKKYEIKLQEEMNAFKKEKEKEKKEEQENPRPYFIRTLNYLGKVGFKIDKNSTTVEELAYMIRQQQEEIEAIK